MPPKPARRAKPLDIRRKIVQFFAENEGSIDTPRGVATWINESLPAVRKALEGLVKDGVLKAHRTSSTVAYSCPLEAKALAKFGAASARRKKK